MVGTGGKKKKQLFHVFELVTFLLLNYLSMELFMDTSDLLINYSNCGAIHTNARTFQHFFS